MTRWVESASGLFASCPTDVEGPARIVNSVEDIVALMRDDDAQQCIALTSLAGGTAVSTVIKRIKAIVSTIGGPHSHIVMLARDYEVPCIVAAEELDIDSIEAGTPISLTSDGRIRIGVAEGSPEDADVA